MSKLNSMSIYQIINNVKKMPCGRIFKLDPVFYGTIKAYRAKNGKRMFSLSNSLRYPNGGNLPLGIVVSDLVHWCE